MKIIYTQRGGGKTTKLLEEARKLKGYNLIVCIDKKEAQRVWKEILLKKYKLPQPITFKEFIDEAYCGMNINSFLIDNADLFLQHLSRGVKIHAVTFTKEEDLK